MRARGRILHNGGGEALVAQLPRATQSVAAPWLSPVPPRAVRDAFAPPPPAPDPVAEDEAARQVEWAKLEADKKQLSHERAQVRELQARYAARLAEVANDVNTAARPTSSAVVELAMVVARELIGRELGQDAQILGTAVEEGLRALDGEQPLQVRLSPQDIEAVRALPQFAGAKVELIADQKLDAGGCIIESARSLIDRSLDKRLEAVRAAVLDLFEGRGVAEGEEDDEEAA